jgi:hypothetical protein
MRLDSPRWHLTYGAGISAALERLPRPLVQHLRLQLEDLVELAHVAPLPLEYGEGSPTAHTLHFTVGDYLVTYVLDAQARQLLVTHIERL